jgi:hypothetical protein
MIISKKYIIIPSKDVIDKIRKEIQIRFPDGFPRWIYKF